MTAASSSVAGSHNGWEMHLPVRSHFEQGIAVVLQSLVEGKPRILLLLFNWNVGEAHGEQCAAALAISAASFLLTVAIYVAAARCCCGARHQVLARQKQRLPHEDLWTVHNRRYDLRDFMRSHPGGVDAIVLGRGRNCTELFESYHSLADTKRVRRVLATHYVEDTPPGAPDYDDTFQWETTPFFDALRRRVRAHFDAVPGADPRAYRADAHQCAQLVFFVVASAIALAGFMRGHAACALLLPVCYWLGPSPCMHDGAHFSLSRHGWVNRVCAHVGGAHMSHFSWSHQHTIGHHVHTNMATRDPDLHHFSYNTELPGFRTSPELPPLPSTRWRSAWCLMGLALRAPLATFGPTLLWDIASLADHELGYAFLGVVPFSPLSSAGLASHSVGRAVVIWLAVIHPITVCLVLADSWLVGLVKAAAFVLTPYALHGCIFYTFSQISHVQPSCFPAEMAQLALTRRRRPAPRGDGCVPTDGDEHLGPHERLDPHETESLLLDAQPPPPARQEWAHHQVEHALDYASGSRLWLHLSVGLNLQVEHHLFPQVGWGHYRALAPIVRATCAEYGVSYAHQPTFWAALKAHYAHLQRLNCGDLADEWAVRPPGKKME